MQRFSLERGAEISGLGRGTGHGLHPGLGAGAGGVGGFEGREQGVVVEELQVLVGEMAGVAGVGWAAGVGENEVEVEG